MNEIGDVYKVLIYFDDGTNRYKSRPALIINKQTFQGVNIFTIAEITSVSPKSPPTYYDGFKVPIREWGKIGLDKKSYVKTHNIHKIEEDKLYEYIGKMNNKDFELIFDTIIENFS